MPAPYKKIGLIQTSPLPGDFSNNLRSLVQGYRDCLDHGAEIVLAPAEALSGLAPRDLVHRNTYIQQLNAAFETLSHEIGSIPLLTCSYTPIIEEDDLWDGLLGEEDADPELFDRSIGLTPMLVEHDSLTELDDGEVNDIDGRRVFVCIGEDEMAPDVDNCDLMVHFAIESWHSRTPETDAEARAWEARTNDTLVACLRSVGMADGALYGGGSVLYSTKGALLHRLPFFEVASAVVSVARPKPMPALPEPTELLNRALELGIRDMVRHNGYGGVCVPMDSPHSTLLAALAVNALGSGNVSCITFCGNTAAAKALGTEIHDLSSAATEQAALKALRVEDSPALVQRLRAAIMQTMAEDRGLLLLSPLDRHSLLTGAFTLYGESCGALAPLGNLYPIDLYLLSRLISEEKPGLFGSLAEPAQPELDRILHELADLNIGASELLSRHGLLFRENDVRLMQRKIIASALRRRQLPTVLHIDPAEERVQIPTCHRLND